MPSLKDMVQGEAAMTAVTPESTTVWGTQQVLKRHKVGWEAGRLGRVSSRELECGGEPGSETTPHNSAPVHQAMHSMSPHLSLLVCSLLRQ